MPYTVTTALWEGATGLPGYTRMKWNSPLESGDAELAANKQRAFFSALASLIPSDIAISWDGLAQQYSDERVLTGEVAYSPPAAISGSAAGAYAAPVGMVVNWLTNDFVSGRRLRGRTFLVPLANVAFFTDGTPTTAALQQVQEAATNLIAGDPLLVINGGSPGARITRVVSGATAPDRAAVLRSRRD